MAVGTQIEAFRLSGVDLDFGVTSFWRWAYSDLLSNTLRGILAEYIVARAIGAKLDAREEWAVCDVISPSGVTIEVKFAAYLQTWEQTNLSRISFSIKPTRRVGG